MAWNVHHWFSYWDISIFFRSLFFYHAEKKHSKHLNNTWIHRKEKKQTNKQTSNLLVFVDIFREEFVVPVFVIFHQLIFVHVFLQIFQGLLYIDHTSICSKKKSKKSKYATSGFYRYTHTKVCWKSSAVCLDAPFVAIFFFRMLLLCWIKNFFEIIKFFKILKKKQ